MRSRTLCTQKQCAPCTACFRGRPDPGRSFSVTEPAPFATGAPTASSEWHHRLVVGLRSGHDARDGCRQLVEPCGIEPGDVRPAAFH